MYPWSANLWQIVYHQILKNDHYVRNYETMSAQLVVYTLNLQKKLLELFKSYGKKPVLQYVLLTLEISNKQSSVMLS